MRHPLDNPEHAIRKELDLVLSCRGTAGEDFLIIGEQPICR